MLEFTLNDRRDVSYGDPERRGYEQLIRKLGGMRGAPAILQLHHYAWWHAVGEGVEDGGLYYFPAGEAQLSVFAHVSGGGGEWVLLAARGLGWDDPCWSCSGKRAVLIPPHPHPPPLPTHTLAVLRLPRRVGPGGDVAPHEGPPRRVQRTWHAGCLLHCPIATC